MGSAFLCLLFLLLALFHFPLSEANRLTSARVPNKDARGPSAATEGDYVCFFDHENDFQICFKEGMAPRFNEGEPGYGTQSYLGYFTRINDLMTQLGYVYGHSLIGKVNVYLVFQFEGNTYSYSFDYCPEIWKMPPTARFSVYHVIKGGLTSSEPEFVELISKDPFVQENDRLGIPGGAQVHCSTEKFPVPFIPPPPPPTPPPTAEASSGPGRGGTPGKSKNVFNERAPSYTTSNVSAAGCFYDDYFPTQRWYFTGGAGSALDGQGDQIHQYYRGKVHDRDTDDDFFSYGHSPRGSRHLILSANVEGRGLVTYHAEFKPGTAQIQAGYIYVGALDRMELIVPFGRAQFYEC